MDMSGSQWPWLHVYKQIKEKGADLKESSLSGDEFSIAVVLLLTLVKVSS